tara:strand:- start:260 stop:421 length:162 start_codon:yes stop_codon:yes gene_type:complete
MDIDICERCEEKKPLEKYSYRVVCEEGTINLDVNYCTQCCDEIEELMKAEANE